MTTIQIVTLSIFTVVIFFTYIKSSLSEDENYRLGWGALQMIFTGIMIALTFLMTSEREDALKRLNGKCPQLEKLENVYKIK